MTKIIEKKYHRNYRGYLIIAKLTLKNKHLSYDIYVKQQGYFMFKYLNGGFNSDFNYKKSWWNEVAEPIRETKRVIDIIIAFKDLPIDHDYIFDLVQKHDENEEKYWDKMKWKG